jgi:uncharacterized protein (TIGR00268 family)
MRSETRRRFERAKELLHGRNVLVAFSGGVDSSVLALLAKDSAQRAVLLTVVSPIVPSEERMAASVVAKEIGLEHRTIEFDWLSRRELTNNNEERCYHCKLELAGIWIDTAKKLGLDTVVEGTTASEAAQRRPGVRALAELGVASPLLEAGISKEEAREYAREHRLSTAERPSMACLATRFPYGTEVTLEKLNMVDSVEGMVREIFHVECVRARYHGDVVRIEVGRDEMAMMFDLGKLDTLYETIRKTGFTYAALDIRGYRTGSMDELVSE